MTLPGVLRPVLDAIAPEDPAAPGRRIRKTALYLAAAAWLLPDYPRLGTGTTANRVVLCAAFVVAAFCAQFRVRWKWARGGLLIAACVAAGLVGVLSGGSLWGLAFLAFTLLVLGLSEARRRYVRVALPPPDPDPRPPRRGAAALALTGYAWFAIGVLVVVHWTGQMMMVPTGSMQPTIMGARGANVGDFLLTERFSYLFRDPKRFEIVVFQFPLYRERLFVKRLVGLPGEHLEIKDGDLWVNGAVVRKPPLLQHTLWREQFPRPGSHGEAKDVVPLWMQSQADAGGDWKRLSPTEVRGTRKGGPTFAAFQGKLESADVRLAFDARADAADSVVSARITSGGVPVTLDLPAFASAPPRFAVGKADADAAPAGLLGADASQFHRIELTVLDGEASWSFDGREQQRLPISSRKGTTSRAEIGVSGQATFRDIRLDTDISWSPGGGPASYDIPADSFLMFGDNVAQSNDSRKWTADVVRTADGRVFRAASTLLTETGDDGPRNFVVKGANWTFVDADGVPREVPREGSTIDTVPSPFVRREHLVARAFMILFPWTVHEAGFRPRLFP